MKKRIADAVGILVLLIAVFLIVNVGADITDKAFVTIDGEVYNISQTELDLTLMTEEGIEQLERFTRLRTLRIIPYKAAVMNSLNTEDSASVSYVQGQVDDVYDDCTDVESIGFLAYAPKLKKLSIAYCGVSDISALSVMSELEELNISYTRVDSLDALADMKSIKKLYIDHIPCDDLSPLLTLDSLEYLRTSAEEDDPVIVQLMGKGTEVQFVSETDR